MAQYWGYQDLPVYWLMGYLLGQQLPELVMTQTRLYTYVYIPIILSLILKNSFTKAVLVAATG